MLSFNSDGPSEVLLLPVCSGALLPHHYYQSSEISLFQALWNLKKKNKILHPERRRFYIWKCSQLQSPSTVIVTVSIHCPRSAPASFWPVRRGYKFALLFWKCSCSDYLKIGDWLFHGACSMEDTPISLKYIHTHRCLQAYRIRVFRLKLDFLADNSQVYYCQFWKLQFPRLSPRFSQKSIPCAGRASVGAKLPVHGGRVQSKTGAFTMATGRAISQPSTRSGCCQRERTVFMYPQDQDYRASSISHYTSEHVN